MRFSRVSFCASPPALAYGRCLVRSGALLPQYLQSSSRALLDERGSIATELRQMVSSIDHIKGVVATQQGHARAMTGLVDREKRLTLRLAANVNRLTVCVADVGEGIGAENLARIFSHAWLRAAQLRPGRQPDGRPLSVRSGGHGRSAEFILELPLNTEVKLA